MGSPRFVSPGALGGNAIEEFLMKQAMAKRQAQMDAMQQQMQQQQSSRQDAALQLQQQQEQRIAEDRDAQALAQAEQHKATLMDRADTRALSFMNSDANRMAQAERDKQAQEAAAARQAEMVDLRRDMNANRP